MSDTSRRDFMKLSAAAITLPLLPQIVEAEAHETRVGTASGTPLGPSTIDADLLEITVAGLHHLYDSGKYTAEQVTRWYLDRIMRYNPTYRAMLSVDRKGALTAAQALDTARRASPTHPRPPLWGVPIVTKANTSVKNHVTSAGWWGFVIPGQELIAPKDATIVAKLRAAGAIILGQTNMPDFAASDANFSTVFGRTGNAYDVRFSPGGSSGGTVTAVTANFCVLGNGTDTGNSIRMPAGTSSVVGVFPTRGLTSIAGIYPLDWTRDNTGPITRTVTDAAIALDVMAGADIADPRTKEAETAASKVSYTTFLKSGALKGKKFGVPAFIMKTPPPGSPADDGELLHPQTRALLMKAIDEVRAAGATVIFDDALLTDAFVTQCFSVQSGPYHNEGIENFLREYGPSQYHSAQEYATSVGSPIPGFGRGNQAQQKAFDAQKKLETDPDAENNFWKPMRTALATYNDALDKYQLDGLIYPSAQMPPNNEVEQAKAGIRSSGPHSNTAWADPIGIPAVVVPAGFYDNGLPFGLEFSARRWKDGDLLGWAYAYEQATMHRKPPVLK